MPPSGAIIVLPSCVNEYSTAMALDCVTRRAIKPADSRLRSVRVSIRCETLPSLRRNCACRWGLSSSENKTFGVHLPMKMDEATFDPCVVFMPPCLLRERDLTSRICLSRLYFPVATFPACQCCAPCAIRNMHVPRRVRVRLELETARYVAHHLPYSSWRFHQTPVSLRPLGARSSHWYAPQRPSNPRA